MKEDDIDGIEGEISTSKEYIEFPDVPVFTEEEIERDLRKIKKGVEDFKKQGKKKEKKEKVTPYLKIPESLAFDDKVPAAGKIVYATYFKFSPQKILDKYPYTFVKQSTLAKHLPLSEDRISKLTILLERERWIEVIRRGQGRSQIVVLLPEKGRTLPNEERQRIRNMANMVWRQYRMDSKTKQ